MSDIDLINYYKSTAYSFPNLSDKRGVKKPVVVLPKKTLSQEEIKNLIQKEIPELNSDRITENLNISKPLELIDRKVQLRINKNINRVIITIVDKQSNEVIKEIPCEELQNLALHLREAIGLLFDEKV